MTDPNSAIPETAKPELWRRYDEWRGARHIRFAERHAHQLPGWRNRRAFRGLVLAQILALTIFGVGVVLSYLSTQWFIAPFLIGLLGTLVCQYLFRIVTGSIGDAPVTALDEIQLAQRNSSRSVAFIVLFILMFVPYLILVRLGSSDHVDPQFVYGTAVLMVWLMIAAASLPNALIAWWMPDPDPTDFGAPVMTRLTHGTFPHHADPYRAEEDNK